jgi:hypothetical protein
VVSASGTYGVTITDGNGCTSYCEIEITVNPLPTCHISASPGSEVCAGNNVTLTEDGGDAVSWLWTTNETSSSIVVSASGTYGVTITDGNGCTSYCEIEITVNPLPTCHISASPGSEVCAGNNVTLTEDGGDAVSWLWTTAETTSSIVVSASGTYGVTITDGNGCTSYCEIEITVNPLPTCHISASPGSEVCAGNNVILTENGGDAVSWLWTTAETTSSIVVSASGTYGVTITDGNGCTSYCEIEITVYAQPVATASSNSPVSQGATIELYGGPDGMASYNWTGPNSFTSSLQNATIPNATTAMAGTYTLTVINGNGCSDVATTNVVVQVPPSTPTVTTQAATGVTTSSATPYMNYTMGNSTSVDVRFAYKKSTSSAWSYTDWVTKSADGTYTVSLTGLSSNTKYDLKAELKYASTVIESAILQFTTAISALPPSQGCFIATAAYGTPTAKQIDVLREFRDVVLLKSTVGSQFVALYYRLSPPIANFIAGNEILRTLVRELLVDPIVRTIEATGDIWRN